MSNSHGEGAAKTPLLNIANVPTIIRLALMPALIVACLDDASVGSARTRIVLATAAFTGKADGYLACSRNLVIDFGKIADSTADKALISSALILLSWHGHLYWWITVIMTGRKLFITVMRIAVVEGKVMAVGHGGKIKMFFQSMGVAGLLILWASFLPGALTKGLLWISYAMIGVVLYCSVVSAVGYVAETRKIARGERGRAPV